MQKAVSRRTEQTREKETEREGDSVRVWVVGVGFWLKIEPLSFSPFASFFVLSGTCYRRYLSGCEDESEVSLSVFDRLLPRAGCLR